MNNLFGEAFEETVWEKTPRVFRGVLNDCSWCQLSPMDALEMVKKSGARVRLFRLRDDLAKGRSESVELPVESDICRFYESARSELWPITALINQADVSISGVSELRSSFGLGREWRHDDVVLTVSMIGSGIGLHSGHEDGFICQMAGLRSWKVFSPADLPEQYLLSVMGAPLDVKELEGEGLKPIMEVELRAGDVLYLPPLFGHEGVTLDESVSFSVAWHGLNKFYLAKKLDRSAKPTKDSLSLREVKEMFRVIHEYELVDSVAFDQLAIDLNKLFGIDVQAGSFLELVQSFSQ